MAIVKVYEADNAEYQEESANYLRELFPMGSEVSTVVKQVSRDGMNRTISVLGVKDGRIVNVSYHVARVVGWKYDNNRSGVRVGGCGMDMGFHVVYCLAQALYGSREGYSLNQCRI